MPVDVVISRAQFKLTNAATPPAERTAPPRRRYRPGCVWGPAGPPLFLKVLLYRRGENVFVSTHIVLHNSNACFIINLFIATQINQPAGLPRHLLRIVSSSENGRLVSLVQLA